MMPTCSIGGMTTIAASTPREGIGRRDKPLRGERRSTTSREGSTRTTATSTMEGITESKSSAAMTTPHAARDADFLPI
jgi:hypothetical protein